MHACMHACAGNALIARLQFEPFKMMLLEIVTLLFREQTADTLFKVVTSCCRGVGVV